VVLSRNIIASFRLLLKFIANRTKSALIFGGLFASLFHWRWCLSKPIQPQLDAFDRKILAILQKDNTTPQRTIGEAVNLSAPAVQRRIKRMEEDGVIQANVAVVDPVAVGQAITIFVEVEVISETADQIEMAKREFAAAAEIQQCYYVTGEADFILVIVVPTMADYEALTRRLFFGNNNVKRFRTFVAMDRVKVGLGVQVDS
jgi:Lrp/AsnC family transcriptional regulator, leucine-responsive regulatory protein